MYTLMIPLEAFEAHRQFSLRGNFEGAKYRKIMLHLNIYKKSDFGTQESLKS